MNTHIYNKKVFEILTSNNAFCNFCLKNIENENENSYYFEDEVVLDNNDKCIKLTDLVCYVFGVKAASFRASGILCRQCTNSTIVMYQFIKMCNYNIEQLWNAVAILENRLNSILKLESDKKTLFITVDSSKSLTPLIYDNKPAAGNYSMILERFQQISNIDKYNLKCMYELSNDLDHCEVNHSIEVNEKANIKFKQNKKKNKAKKISINEIIFDTNKMSQYKCKICFNIYSNLYRLKQHFLRMHAPKDFVCSECCKSYGSEALLAQHKYDCHSPFMCSDCGKSYTSRSTFKTHMQSHRLKLICQVCGKVFKNKRNFSKHIIMNICDPVIRKMNLDKKYVCDYCRKGYSSKSTLRTHIKFAHGDGEAQVCSWCNKRFHAVSRLTAHIVTHTQEKKFSCDVCGGRFVTKESLLYHTRIHTGERPYKCQYCDKRFLSTSRRAEHIRRHHSDPMLECNICHSKFRSKSCLTRHKKRHFNPNSRLHYARLVSNGKEI
ncbi:unnamed protein product [Diatraea saccharalis]|uniref:C2H2-type domain-containing protein n=1 Tax=Diatraea saccharalis TaxID=40085 RepID=A0A9N9WD60_9NEOP|nr:unnamed protein product [Diatraea saccharalis]